MAGSVEITCAGSTYGIARGDGGYGIWRIARPTGRPLETFPGDAAGWFAANARLRELEEGRGAPARRRARPEMRMVAVAGLVLGVALGVAGLFPHYNAGASLASSHDELAVHLFYLGGWTLGAIGLAVTRRYRLEAALFGLGLSTIAFGLFLADLGTATSGGNAGAGLALSIASYVLCTAASALAVIALRADIAPEADRTGRVPLAVLGGLCALGAAIAFAPSWDRFVVELSSSGTVRVLTLGNAFSNPGVVVAGNVVTMVLIVAVTLVALAWLPLRAGAALLLGALVPLVAQIVAAAIQIHEHIEPALFGMTRAQAATDRLVVGAGLTGVYYAFAVFVAALVVLGAIGATRRHLETTAH